MSSIAKITKVVKAINDSFDVREENGSVILTGHTDNYNEIILAGKAALSKDHYGVINNITFEDYKDEFSSEATIDYSLENLEVDCLVIGGGVIGSAILRELSKYKLNSILIEKEADLAMHQSGRNTGVIHTGIQFFKYPKKALYTVKGNMMFDKLSQDLEVPFERKGHMIFLKNAFEKYYYRKVSRIAKKLHISGVKLINKKTLLSIENEAPKWANYAIYLPTGGSINPFKFTVALAENAVENGALVFLNTKCESMNVENGIIKSVKTNRGRIYPKLVINAAGIYADKIAEMAMDRTFTIHPRKGTSVVLDKRVFNIASKTSFIKSPITVIRDENDTFKVGLIRGIRRLISYNKKHTKEELSTIHTVDDNVILGPLIKETPLREDYSVDIDQVNYILEEQRKVSPKIKKSDCINYYTGIRASTYEEDYVIRSGIFTKNIIEVAGIDVSGITASPAIAEMVANTAIEYFKNIGTSCILNKTFNPHHASVKSIKDYPITLRDKLIKSNYKYGIIVCKCEEISLGEIENCLNSPIPVYSIDAIKKRIRAGMGRCQGSICSPLIVDILRKKKRTDILNIKKSNNESTILFKKIEEDSR
ncbi:FAD-dependent oxidoreductase [bacterium]|nr:FAD-dependent oxidoreductase [bacterium]